MRSFWKNAWFLVIAVVLPIIAYAAYQLSTLSEDEENISMIYQNQLDAILFSVNQYSDDIVKGWINTMEESMESDTNVDSLISYNLFQFQPAVFQIYIRELDKEIILTSAEADTSFTTDFYQQQLPDPASDQFEQLRNYAENGFQKILSSQFNEGDRSYLLLSFIMLSPNNTVTSRMGAIILDPELFIRETLSTKFQTVAQDKFVVSAYRRDNTDPVYSTADSVNSESIAVTNNFWLLPNYYLAIGTPGKPVQDIIRERTVTNLGILLTLIAFLGIAAFLILRNVRKEMRLAQKKADFVSNVSHELRTPLALISMFAETLEMDRVPTEEKKKEYYQIMQKESGRLTGIVNKILTFSQMDNGKKQFRHDKIDLNEIVAEVVSNYEFHLRTKGFSHVLSLSEEPLPIEGDKEAIAEVLINLLDNAIKYSTDTKEITVRTVKGNEKAVMTVQDKGIGIPKGDQAQVFEKFFRVSVGDLAQSKGTGLGLSLVKQIIDEHKGDVRLESEPGKGSIFMILFPLLKQ
ncbi:sensor histidine kinase [Fulvivirga sedimenti]|uniref:histidine kinase n=1 Tax=Fulvivirga sedimenti TaxID=2879465 RepID=A0A9X1HNX4_9BACT|nr:ATP-binding protein [Fulvivirga sedimenti]MCA6074082.1 HAMP domain-containing histidine kinase [Fulvivirga sedimenti]